MEATRYMENLDSKAVRRGSEKLAEISQVYGTMTCGNN